MTTDASPHRQHLVYLDYLRAVCIISIVCIHALDPFWMAADRTVGSWWVLALTESLVRIGLPLFFMISGALLLRGGDEPLRSHYARRVPKLLIPLVIYSLLYGIWNSRESLSLTTPVAILRDALAGPVWYHLWFLYSLIGLYIAAPFVKKMVSATSTRWLATLCAIMVAWWGLRIYGPHLGVSIGLQDLVFDGWVVYFLLGAVLVRVDLRRPGILAVASLAAGLAGTLTILRWWPGELGLHIFDLSPTMILMAAGVFLLFRRGESWFALVGVVGRLVTFIARNGLGIYLLHAAVLKVVSDNVLDLAPASLPWVALVPTIVLLTIALTVPGAVAIDRLAVRPVTRLTTAMLLGRRAARQHGRRSAEL